jgi:hypothetical protein
MLLLNGLGGWLLGRLIRRYLAWFYRRIHTFLLGMEDGVWLDVVEGFWMCLVDGCWAGVEESAM